MLAIDVTVYDRQSHPLAMRVDVEILDAHALARTFLRVASQTPGAHEVQAQAGPECCTWLVGTALDARRLWSQLQTASAAGV